MGIGIRLVNYLNVNRYIEVLVKRLIVLYCLVRIGFVFSLVSLRFDFVFLFVIKLDFYLVIF